MRLSLHNAAFCAVVALLLHATPAAAQFATVLNVPPGELIENFKIGTDTQVNVSDGGARINRVYVSAQDGSVTNAELNIAGGVFSSVTAYAGGRINQSGGRVQNARFYPGATVQWTGGVVGEFSGNDGNLRIVGGEYRLDGAPIGDGLTPADVLQLNTINPDAVLTGVLADGTPFVVDKFGPTATVTLSGAELPAIGPQVFVASRDALPLGIRSGQTVIVDEGSKTPGTFIAGPGSAVVLLPDSSAGLLNAVDASVEMLGGGVAGIGLYDHASLTIREGTLGFADLQAFVARNASVVTMFDGRISRVWRLHEGSVMNVAGGVVGEGEAVDPGFDSSHGLVLSESRLNVSGGLVRMPVATLGGMTTITGGIWAHNKDPVFVGVRSYGGSPGAVSISGGTLRARLSAAWGGEIHIYGNDFSIDGVLAANWNSDNEIVLSDLPSSAILSGNLADGAHFRNSADVDTDSRIVLHSVDLPAAGPALISAPADAVPPTLRSGQTLVLGNGGATPDYFRAGPGSAIVVAPGGRIGEFADAYDALVNVDAGSIGQDFTLYGSELTVSGGAIKRVWLNDGTVASVSEGTIDAAFVADRSEINVSGGTIKSLYIAPGQQATARVSGGTIESIYFRDGTLQFAGTHFLLNGEPLGDLLVNQTLLLGEGAGTISGNLADGTPFSFSVPLASSPDYEVNVLLSLVENGDFNQDGAVDGGDFLAWQRGYGAADGHAGGDANGDGVVDGLDLARWQRDFKPAPAAASPVAAAVAEPAAIALGLLIPLDLLILARLTSRLDFQSCGLEKRFLEA